MFDSESYHQLNIVKDKEKSWKSQLKKVITFNPNIGRQNYRFTTTDTD